VSFTRLAIRLHAQLADIVESILSRKVQRVEWSVLVEGGTGKDPDDHIKKYRVVFAEGKGFHGQLIRRSMSNGDGGYGCRTVGTGEFK